MKIEIVRSLPDDIWRRFVEQHPAGNIFHTPEMFQVFDQAKGYCPGLWAAVDSHGQLSALLLPVRVTLMRGLLQRLTTRSIAYGSLLCSPGSAAKEALATLLSTYVREVGHDTLFTELRNLSDQENFQPVLTGCGFAYEPHLNYLINLQGSANELLQRMGARTRKHIRRELKKGLVTVEAVTHFDQLQSWYGLIQKSYQVASVPLADISLFEAAFEVLKPRNMIKFWIARLGDTLIAASAELAYKHVIVGWYAGVDRAYSKYTPSELLMWHVLKWGAENGYDFYDFGGAGKPHEKYGVRDFKAKFGGRLANWGRNTCVHVPQMFALSRTVYQMYRLMMHLLPSRGVPKFISSSRE